MAELSEQVERTAFKLPQGALDAWVEYDPPEFKHESTRIRDAFMSGFLAALQHPVASSEAPTAAQIGAGIAKLDSRNWDDASSEEVVRAIYKAMNGSSEAPTADQQDDWARPVVEAAQAVSDARDGLVPGYRSPALDRALDGLDRALRDLGERA